VARWHAAWFKPGNATLVVVGDTTLAAIRPKLESLFTGWKGGEAPKKNVAPVEAKAPAAVYVMDRPGEEQSTIFADRAKIEPGLRALGIGEIRAIDSDGNLK